DPASVIATNVQMLLSDNRWHCGPEGFREAGFHFTHPAIAALLYERFFRAEQVTGTSYANLLAKLNDAMICLAAIALHHALRGWRTGIKNYDEKFLEAVYARTLTLLINY